MFRKIIPGALIVTVAALLTPCKVNAYGAAHCGYTHVGPNGVYHTGQTAVRTPYGSYAGGHTSAYGSGGGAYHSGYAAGGSSYGGGSSVHYTAGSGSVYHNVPSYGGSSYGYVR